MTAQITLSNQVEQFSVDRTDTALIINGDLPYEVWVEQGRELNRINGAVMWWLGDWWAFGNQKYGERVQAVQELDLEFGTCVNAGIVARKFETPRRRGVLTWQHHCEVASLDTEDQEHFLNRWEEVATKTEDLGRLRRGHLPDAALGLVNG